MTSNTTRAVKECDRIGDESTVGAKRECLCGVKREGEDAG